jgi:hypothetical protein
MKVTPVSGDFLLKAGLLAAGVGLIAWLAWRNRNLVNPLSPENAANRTVNAIGGALVTSPTGPGKNADGSWTLGGAIFDIFNPRTAQAVRDMTGPVNPATYQIIDYSEFTP